ncbi:hypothetical protein BDN70DRAFT_33587 [Pholiota conissans]|uniref:Uncharacterized protein n=1 Tax=Pholiota conissans TaxID=109636 RepID=A0A9P6CSU6_9AGAR|nr:hypothetical protein BDN70DRAFT_33587 [Pholiota conissans]
MHIRRSQRLSSTSIIGRGEIELSQEKLRICRRRVDAFDLRSGENRTSGPTLLYISPCSPAVLILEKQGYGTTDGRSNHTLPDSPHDVLTPSHAPTSERTFTAPRKFPQPGTFLTNSTPFLAVI